MFEICFNCDRFSLSSKKGLCHTWNKLLKIQACCDTHFQSKADVQYAVYASGKRMSFQNLLSQTTVNFSNQGKNATLLCFD